MRCMVGAVVSMFRVPISLLSIRLTSSSKIYKCLMLYVTLHFLLPQHRASEGGPTKGATVKTGKALVSGSTASFLRAHGAVYSTEMLEFFCFVVVCGGFFGLFCFCHNYIFMHKYF